MSSRANIINAQIEMAALQQRASDECRDFTPQEQREWELLEAEIAAAREEAAENALPLAAFDTNRY